MSLNIWVAFEPKPKKFQEPSLREVPWALTAGLRSATLSHQRSTIYKCAECGKYAETVCSYALLSDSIVYLYLRHYSDWGADVWQGF